MKKTYIQCFVALPLSISLIVAVTPPAGRAAEIVGWGSDYFGETSEPSGLSNVVAIAAGGYCSVALTAEGRVMAWGDRFATNMPAGLSNVVAISAGASHSLALAAEGRVAAWGVYDILGAAKVPAGLSNVVAVAAGGYHSLALTADGGIVAWGDRSATNTPRGLSNVVAIAAGANHSLALTAHGQVVAWGATGPGTPDNVDYGQTIVPSALSNIVAVAAGEYHSLALTDEGKIVAWGDNRYGQTNVPSGLSNVVQIAAGGLQNLALTAEGQVVAWGDFWNGKTYVTNTVPNGLSNALAVAAGIAHCLVLVDSPPGLVPPVVIGPRFLMAVVDQPFQYRLRAKNSVTAYGAVGLPSGLIMDNTGFITGRPLRSGKFIVTLSATNSLGSDFQTVTLFVNPAAMPGINSPGFSLVGLGNRLDLPVVAYNSPEWYGASGLPPGLGIDPQTGVISGVPVEAGDFTVGLVSTNRFGESTNSLTLRVSPVVGWDTSSSNQTDIPGGLTNVVAIAAGDSFSLALTAEGRVVAWGNNDNRQTEVPDVLTNVVAISAGSQSSLALTGDGEVVAWGIDWGGTRDPPTGVSNVVAIAAGLAHSLVLTDQGRVVAWGNNAVGQTNVPSGLSNVVAIAAGPWHSLALTANGRVVAWGAGGPGTSGNFDLGQATPPSDLSNMVAIAAGGYHNLALTADGRVVAWGAYVNEIAPLGLLYPTISSRVFVPSGLSNVIAVAAGINRDLALTADGRVVEWGDTGVGPTNLFNGLSNVVAIALGGRSGGDGVGHSLALLGLPPGVAAPVLIGPRFLMGVTDPPFQYQILAKNGVTAYSTTGLPTGLTFNPSTGLITGQPAQAGRYEVVLSATNNLGSDAQIVTLYVNPSAAPAIDSTGIRQLGLGLDYSFPVPAHNAPDSYAATGLPPGLSLDTQTGIISGEPAEPGDYAVSLVVSNRYGQSSGSLTLRVSPLVGLGWSDPSQADIPKGLSNVVAIAVGGSYQPFYLALLAEGRVVQWGGYSRPPSDLSNVVAIAAGEDASLALTAEGRVQWPGAGDTATGLRNVVAIASGSYHSLALTTEGKVVAWGANTDLAGRWVGQATVPDGLSNVVAIAAGQAHSLALTTAGKVVAWGANQYGQTNVPGGVVNAVAIAAGGNDSLALRSSGRVMGWGLTQTPAGLSNAVAIVVGRGPVDILSGNQCLALLSDGSVLSWGLNPYPGVLERTSLSNVVAIATGGLRGLALLQQPTVSSSNLALRRDLLALQLQAQGAPGISCLLLRASQLPGPWLPAQPVTFTNSIQWLRAPDISEPAQYFRLLRK